jgi:hypothetical protein
MLVAATLEHSSETVMAHMKLDCVGRACPLHNRSEHGMRGWQQTWRSDIRIIERVCPHGVGHPDPDQFMFWDLRGELVEKRTHVCDGCCTPVMPAKTMTRVELINEMTSIVAQMNMNTEDVIPIEIEVTAALDWVMPKIMAALANDVEIDFDERGGITEYIMKWRPRG